MMTKMSQPDRVPWFLWCAVLAVTSAMIGVHWDISWHRSIGRDTFWTPPHLAIYLCGVLGGIASGYLILTTTFGARSKDESVRVFGFRGPLGAFVCAWGGIAMLASAPFDDWWHNAYGLDVKIISPPHTLLSLGIFSVMFGSLLLVLGYLNRAEGPLKRLLAHLFLYLGGLIVVLMTVFLMERTDRSDMHAGDFYLVLSIALPMMLVGIGRAADRPWATTQMAVIYTVVQLGLLWILPLFPAVPKLGPVYYPVTHLVPPPFPLLLLPSAVALDLVRARARDWSPWRESLISGVLFLAILIAVQWPFANFLQSPAARNWLFGTKYFDYNTRPFWHNIRYVFAEFETRAQFWRAMGTAPVAAIVTSRLGITWGNWMRQIRR